MLNRRRNRHLSPSSSQSKSDDRSSVFMPSLFKNLYRKASGQALAVAVKPQLVGELPDLSPNKNTLTFYVLKDYSRSNSVLIDLQTQEHHLPPALVGVQDARFGIDEHAGILFLHHPNANHGNNTSKANLASGKLSPRLARLVAASLAHPELTIRLVPVTIIWGRAPEKEDSLFKLLVADNWQEPSISKQLFNIGIMGRDTYVQFHKPMYLKDLIAQSGTHGNTDNPTQPHKPSASTALLTTQQAQQSLTLRIHHQLTVFLDKRRASILGPDLSDKRNVIDKLLYSPAIRHAIEQESQKTDKPIASIRQKARSYLNEIATDYSYPVIRFFEHFLNWLWTQLYDGVQVQHFERIRELADDHEIIYVPCHRSHIDYLLLSFIIYKHGLSIPYVAAGNNLNIPILGKILRSAGAFFMRRSFKGNELYATVFKEYVHSIICRNQPIEYFIEGGRSRTGRLLPPKLGMISMTVQSHLRQASKPIVFIPTYIGYERIMEGATYVGELKGKPKESESLLGLLKVSRKIERIFGTVHLSFGSPLYLQDFMDKFNVQANHAQTNHAQTNKDTDDADIIVLTNTITQMVENIGVKILQNINKAAVVTPVSLLGLVLLSTPKSALDEDSCQKQLALYQRLAREMPYDADTTITQMTPKAIIDYGIKLKLIERTPHILGDMIQVANNQAALLSYFRNNILHVFILPSFLAALMAGNGRLSRTLVHDITSLLYPFLQSELFLKYSSRNLNKTIDCQLDNLIELGLMVDLGTDILAAPEQHSEPYQQLKLLGSPVEQSLERYFMTLALLAQQGSGKLSAEQVVDLSQLLGQRLSVLHADDIPDAFDRSLFTSFINALIRLNYLHTDADSQCLQFDQRIKNIAHYARYVLKADTMQMLHQISDLDDSEIEYAINEMTAKKQKKFALKR